MRRSVANAVGNLVFDGQLVYRYDAFNRLVDVHLKGDLSLDDFDANGHIDPQPETDALGALKYRFGYDGLSRLITVQTIHDYVDQQPRFRTVHYYYDGVRRVQEVVATPAANPQDPDVLTTDREYVYGPEYVDEFVLQDDAPGATEPVPFYMLPDANYNVMALVDEDANVREQYAYEPYGTVAAMDIDTQQGGTRNQAAHQGLFFYPLDGTGLTADARGLYYNRNRWYSPTLGRFLQRDPNETGLAVVPGEMKGGQSLFGQSGQFDAGSHYADGLNLYLCLRSSPLVTTDPSGLFSYLEVLGATGLGLQMDANTADIGVSAAKAIRGMVGLINARNMMLGSLTGMAASPVNTSAVDLAIAGYAVYQDLQSIMIAGGIPSIREVALHSGCKRAGQKGMVMTP